METNLNQNLNTKFKQIEKMNKVQICDCKTNYNYSPGGTPCENLAEHKCEGCGDVICTACFHPTKNKWTPHNIKNRCSACYFYIMGQRDSENYSRRP